MARAKYFDGNDYKDWTADMVGGLSIDGTPNRYIHISHQDGNPTGYYLVARKTFTTGWVNSRALWMISSRHSGNGIVSIVADTYSSKTDVHADISLFTEKLELTTPNLIGVIYDNIFDIYVYIADYEAFSITPLLFNFDTGLKPYNGGLISTLPSGTQVPAHINGQQIYVQSSAPTDSEAVIWVQT